MIKGKKQQDYILFYFIFFLKKKDHTNISIKYKEKENLRSTI